MKKETVSILKNFASIAPAIFMKKGNYIRVRDVNSCIIAECNVEDKFARDFAIYDMNQFLSVLTMQDGAEVDYQETCAEITWKKNKTSLKYYYAATAVMKDAIAIYDFDVGSVFTNKAMTFELSADELDQLIKAASIMKLDRLWFDCKHKKLMLDDKSGSNKNTYELVCKDVEVESPMEVAIDLNNMKLIPGSYSVSVFDIGVIFKNVANPSLIYYILRLSND